jgi:D-sedoheptulose 7-phosphate isomerase
MSSSLSLIQSSLSEHNELMQALASCMESIDQAISLFETAFKADSKILVCGNGGSAADAQHFATELTVRFEKDRRGFPAIALTTDTSALTAISNDLGSKQVFSRQLEALGREGDVLLAISTSGNSPNVVQAVELAKNMGVHTVGLLGGTGGALGNMVDCPIKVPSSRTARIQEAHIFILHSFCEALEQNF